MLRKPAESRYGLFPPPVVFGWMVVGTLALGLACYCIYLAGGGALHPPVRGL